jgi:hypothetical protein
MLILRHIICIVQSRIKCQAHFNVFSMYNFEFYSASEQPFQTTLQILERKSFSKQFYRSPSYGHSYSVKFYPNPIR